MRIQALFLALFCVLIGCSGNDVAGPKGHELQEVAAQNTATQSPFETWQHYQLEEYVIEQQVRCFCSAELVSKSRFVYVQQDSIVNVVEKDTFDPIERRLWSAYKTVDQLFSLVVVVEADSNASANVDYNAKFGFPTELYIDYHALMADDEMRYITKKLYKYPE